jgi:hypothetical protein
VFDLNEPETNRVSRDTCLSVDREFVTWLIAINFARKFRLRYAGTELGILMRLDRVGRWNREESRIDREIREIWWTMCNGEHFAAHTVHLSGAHGISACSQWAHVCWIRPMAIILPANRILLHFAFGDGVAHPHAETCLCGGTCSNTIPPESRGGNALVPGLSGD